MSEQSQQKVIDALSQLSYRCTTLISKACKLSNQGYRLKDKTACFGVIPYHSLGFLAEELERIQKLLLKELKQRPKFLDIGCGTGNIVMLAYYLGYKAAGLEYNLRTFRVAKQMCNAPYLVTIIRGDMRAFEHYSEYDVLYYYQPMAGCEVMEKFTTRLAKEMKPGAYVICIGTTHGFRQSEKFEKIPGNYGIWRKK